MSQFSNGKCLFVEMRKKTHLLFTYFHPPPVLHALLLYQSGKMEFVIQEEGHDVSHLNYGAPGGWDNGPNPAAEGPEGAGENPSDVPSPTPAQK